MSSIVIVYASTFGNTRLAAERVAAGVDSVTRGAALLLPAESASLNECRSAAGIIVGTPIRHRSADSRIKAFIERVFEVGWLTDDFVGKTGGVFSVGGGYGNCGAGCEVAQLGVLAAMAACGMLLVPLPKTTPGSAVAGSHWGPHGRSGGPSMEPVGVSAEMLEAFFFHGANVARVAHATADRDLLARGNVAPSPELVKLFTSGGM